MNSNMQRRFVMTLALVAGAAASAAMACPPEENGSPDPAQETRMIELPGGGTVKVVSSKSRINTTNGDHFVTLFGHPQGSTLETRVYKPGEAAALYNLQPATGADVYRMINVVKDGRDVWVEQRGSKITAKVDGKEVPADAVTVKDGTIEVRDADGKTVLKKEWPEVDTIGSRRLTATTIPPMPPVPPVPPGVTWTGQSDEETPKVMLGITMDEADEDAIAQLGLPEGDYAEIATVPQGLPACKAGLQPKDIIVSIDGKTPASAGTIRDVMKTKSPGDKVAIEVVRKGNRVKTEVPLEAFDGKKFRAYAQTMGQNGLQSRLWTEKMSKEMQARAEELTRTMKDPVTGEKLKLAIPRGQNGEPMILMDGMHGDQKALEERLSTLENQLKRVEEMLKRLESRGEQNVTPSGGGGAPKPVYAVGL